MGLLTKKAPVLVRALTHFFSGGSFSAGTAYELPAAQAADMIKAKLVRAIDDEFERNLAMLEIKIRTEIH